MQILNDFGWNSCCNTVCRDVVCNYAIGSYNDSIANGYSWQNALASHTLLPITTAPLDFASRRVGGMSREA